MKTDEDLHCAEKLLRSERGDLSPSEVEDLKSQFKADPSMQADCEQLLSVTHEWISLCAAAQAPARDVPSDALQLLRLQAESKIKPRNSKWKHRSASLIWVSALAAAIMISFFLLNQVLWDQPRVVGAGIRMRDEMSAEFRDLALKREGIIINEAAKERDAGPVEVNPELDFAILNTAHGFSLWSSLVAGMPRVGHSENDLLALQQSFNGRQLKLVELNDLPNWSNQWADFAKKPVFKILIIDRASSMKNAAGAVAAHEVNDSLSSSVLNSLWGSRSSSNVGEIQVIGRWGSEKFEKTFSVKSSHDLPKALEEAVSYMNQSIDQHTK